MMLGAAFVRRNSGIYDLLPAVHFMIHRDILGGVLTVVWWTFTVSISIVFDD